MNTFPAILLALAVLALGYRYYSKFIAAKVMGFGRYPDNAGTHGEV